jgi:hypothetical protein
MRFLLIDSKVQKQPKLNRAVPSKGSPATVAKTPAAGPSQERIRERAYQLYESRGNKPGCDKQDWLHAEQEIL